MYQKPDQLLAGLTILGCSVPQVLQLEWFGSVLVLPGGDTVLSVKCTVVSR